MSDAPNTSMVLENITNGAYQLPKQGKLVPPPVPDILRKTLADITDDEMKEIDEIRRKYREDLELFQMHRDEREQQRAALLNKFRLDLEAEFGTGHHPKRLRLFDLALSYGSENKRVDYNNVLNFYTDLVVLLDLTATSDTPEPVT